MSDPRGNGNRDADAAEKQKRDRRLKEAVRDLPDPERRKLTQEDVDTLREADLDDLAKLAERYV